MRWYLPQKKKKKRKPQTSQKKWKNNPGQHISIMPEVWMWTHCSFDYKMHYIVFVYILKMCFINITLICVDKGDLFCVFQPFFIWLFLCCTWPPLFFSECHFSTTGACAAKELVHSSDGSLLSLAVCSSWPPVVFCVYLESSSLHQIYPRCISIIFPLAFKTICGFKNPYGWGWLLV